MLKVILFNAGLLFSINGYAKNIILNLKSQDYSIVFSDNPKDCEDELSSITEKYSKNDLQEFLCNEVSHYLRRDGMNWTCLENDNISDVFHEILNTFKYNNYIYICEVEPEPS